MLVNSGNLDRPVFPMGIKFLQAGIQAIHIERKTQDRHHSIELSTIVSPANPQSTIDFTLRPFHRDNVYTLTFYVIMPEGINDPGQDVLEPTSGESTRFVALSGRGIATEVLTDALAEALGMALPIPMKVTVIRSILRLIKGSS